MYSNSKSTIVVAMLLVVVMTVALVAAGGSGEGESELVSSNQVRCVCRCCFHGDCSYIANASWMLDDCGSCSANRCREMIVSSSTRQRISKTFHILQNLETILGAEGQDRKIMLQHTLETLDENRWDVCEVTAMVETVTCMASNTPGACQSSADLSAVCFDRNAPVVKYGTWVFLIAIVGGVVFAFVKNYLIGCQEFNVGSFDY